MCPILVITDSIAYHSVESGCDESAKHGEIHLGVIIPRQQLSQHLKPAFRYPWSLHIFRLVLVAKLRTHSVTKKSWKERRKGASYLRASGSFEGVYYRYLQKPPPKNLIVEYFWLPIAVE